MIHIESSYFLKLQGERFLTLQLTTTILISIIQLFTIFGCYVAVD